MRPSVAEQLSAGSRKERPETGGHLLSLELLTVDSPRDYRSRWLRCCCHRCGGESNAATSGPGVRWRDGRARTRRSGRMCSPGSDLLARAPREFCCPVARPSRRRRGGVLGKQLCAGRAQDAAVQSRDRVAGHRLTLPSAVPLDEGSTATVARRRQCVDNSADARRERCAEAHETWLQGDVQRCWGSTA